MSAVVCAIDGIRKIVDEIVRASSEQAAGIAQVNQAISQMDSTTQENAALVEQSSAAARIMADHATALMAAVSVFRLTSMPPAIQQEENGAAREAEAERVRASMFGG
jgi:methyl-accepting chemotaxis protein